MKGWDEKNFPVLLFVRKSRKERRTMNKNQIIKTVWEMAEPVTEQLGLTLWDVQFVKEGATWSLRIVIDREGGVDMDACEAVSRALDPMLDEADPIDESYVLEVWSAGYDRDLTRDFHFEASLGMPVTVGLFAPEKGREGTGDDPERIHRQDGHLHRFRWRGPRIRAQIPPLYPPQDEIDFSGGYGPKRTTPNNTERIDSQNEQRVL